MCFSTSFLLSNDKRNYKEYDKWTMDMWKHTNDGRRQKYTKQRLGWAITFIIQY